MRKCLILVFLILSLYSLAQARPVVMMTGYWSPTSEMIYRFSNDPVLNPDGWIGENWEGFGYDVYAFFPAFNKWTREFEVDYQATWSDFWARSDEFHPEIIISFGAGSGPWEIEDDAHNRNSWYPDDVAPYYPTPNPPDSTLGANQPRYSTLPMVEIRDAVNAETDVHAWIDYSGNPGNFLCNYIAYLGMWYQNMHDDVFDEHYCKAAGFIHVDGYLSVARATAAAEVTLRSTLQYFADQTGVGDFASGGAESFRLSNYPNPLNPNTTISFYQADNSELQIQIFDVSGRMIRKLSAGSSSTGQQTVVWDGRDSKNQAVASGVYFYRLNQPSSPTNKMVVTR
jgi:pyrrolidone-carboxylate peptidase